VWELTVTTASRRCPSRSLWSTNGDGWSALRVAKRPVGNCAPDVPEGQSGPRLIAFVGLLMAYLRQSKRQTAEFLETCLSLPCSIGLTAALRLSYEELAAQLFIQ